MRSKHFSSLQWKLAVSHAGVSALTVLIIESLFFLGAGVFGPMVGETWSKQIAQRRASTLAARVTNALEARSPADLVQAIDRPAALFPKLLLSRGHAEQWDEAHVVIGTGGHVVASNQPDCYPSGSSFLGPGLPEAERAVDEALRHGRTSSRVVKEAGLYLAALPLTSSQGTRFGVLYYHQPVTMSASQLPRRLLGTFLAATAVALPCAILFGLVLGAISVPRLVSPTTVFSADSDPGSVGAERSRQAQKPLDGVQQRLFGLNLATASALNLLDTDPEAARAKLLEARDQGRGAQAEMEAWLDEFTPADSENARLADAEDQGLAAALADYLSEYEQRTGIAVHWRPVESLRLPLTHEEALVDVAREALANVARHAEAAQVTVELDVGNETVALRIVDDGQGFDPAATMPERTVGLRIAAERLIALGGSYTVGTAPGAGTRIIATLPRA